MKGRREYLKKRFKKDLQRFENEQKFDRSSNFELE